MGPWLVALILTGLPDERLEPNTLQLRRSIEQGVRFLEREVPSWSRENHCFSCHNNGDAARALFLASTRGFALDPNSIQQTVEWLSLPEKWDRNGGRGPFIDKRLARIEFSAALAVATDSGAVRDRRVLTSSAQMIADEQQLDGSWIIDGPDTLGTPATLGRPLATWMARETLRICDSIEHAAAIEQADRWLRNRALETTLDAAVRLLLPPDPTSSSDRAGRSRAIALLQRGRSEDGGWGPYTTSSPEPFDTAIAILGLSRARQNAGDKGVDDLLNQARTYLINAQQPDGSWLETTRPSGGESYAQRISTTGWALIAMLELLDSHRQ